MTHHVFAARTAGTTASLSRRLSLLGLGGAVLAAVVKPSPARAGKAGKKSNKKCKKQIGNCESAVSAFCAGVEPEEREACEALFSPCCALFGGCQGGAAYQCLIDARISLVPPGTRQ